MSFVMIPKTVKDKQIHCDTSKPFAHNFRITGPPIPYIFIKRFP